MQHEHTLQRLLDVAAHHRYLVWGIPFLLAGLLLGALLWGQRAQDPAAVEPPPETIPFTSYPGVESDPALSPNGQQVAFVWNGGTDRNQNIYVKQSSSETPLRITGAYADDYSPAWSPDGQQVAFARVSGTTHSIHLASSLGGSERRIARYGTREIHSLSWSPDTTRQVIAVSVRESRFGPFRIELLDFEADTTWAITSPPSTHEGDVYPVFSNDGTSVAFLRAEVSGIEDVFVASLEEERTRRVEFETSQVTGLSWDASGENLLIAAHRNGSSGLWRVPLSGAEPSWVMAVSERNSILRPTLSRMGDKLAYAQEHSSTNIWQWQREEQAFSANPFISSTRWDSDPAIAPSGEYVAFVSTRSGYREVWRTEIASNESVQLTDLRTPVTGSPSWSPDNEQIAFVSSVSSSASIHVVDAEGGAPRAVTSEESHDLMPSWSRDGNWIYFASDRAGKWQIWMTSPETGHVIPVTEEEGIAAQESIDGSALYVVRPDTAGIWRLDLEDRLDVPIVQASLFGLWQPEPDMQSSDGELELVVSWLSPEDYANWRVTEDGIYFVRRRTDATVLSFYDFTSETIEDIEVLDDVPSQNSFDIAQNGGWFALAKTDRQESDVMIVNHFR